MGKNSTSSNSQHSELVKAREKIGIWLKASEQHRNLNSQILRDHRTAGRKLAATVLNFPYSQPRWTILPLPAQAGILLAARAKYARTQNLQHKFTAFLKLLADGGIRAYRDSITFNSPNFTHNARTQKQAEVAEKFLLKLAEEGARIGFDPNEINIAELNYQEPIPDLKYALAEKFNLAALLSISDTPSDPNLETTNTSPTNFDAININAKELSALPKIIEKLDLLASKLAEYRDRCQQLANELREEATWNRLRQTDIEQLASVSWQPLKLGVLKNVGINNVGEILDSPQKISKIPGIGEKTAQNITAAARLLYREIFSTTPARINRKNKSTKATALLQALCEWETIQNYLGADKQRVLSFAAAIKTHLHQLSFGAERFIIIGRARPAKDFLNYISEAQNLAEDFANFQYLFEPQISEDYGVWKQFTKRAASFYAMLAEIGIPTSDSQKITGELPSQIVAQVQETQLNTDLLAIPLRGYQHFGARFIRAQEKVILGDEMGLGKTLEALAVAADICEQGESHVLVICPAAVVTNWLREISTKTFLAKYRLHGTNRATNASAWLADGGIAVTTYESLGWFISWLNTLAPQNFALSYLIADEAHYIKNQDAKRSQRTSHLLNRAQLAVLLTGTPMENTPDEFRTLIRYIHPHLIHLQSLKPLQFRRQIAPLYLRRTQADVLDELPDLIENEEWIPFSAEDQEIYASAVQDGNFMAMRQAGMISENSAKIARIKEILYEVKANGKKAIIYSYFLRPLEILKQALTDCIALDEEKISIIGPLTGSVSPEKRQEMVDQLTDSEPGSILLAQISAGGVGLNIQAASVVIICEPQLKPTTEWQAIARSHRMGQTTTVNVYRLLSEKSVDSLLRQRLQQKANLFETFADISETASAAASLKRESEDNSLSASSFKAPEMISEIIESEKNRLNFLNSDVENVQTNAENIAKH